jgi:putative transposase
MCNRIRFKEGTIKLVTISKKADEYYASFIIDLPDIYSKKYYIPLSSKNNNYVGIDLGVKTFAYINDSKGKTYISKSIIKTKLKPINDKIDFYQKRLSRKVYGSKKYELTRIKLARLYRRKHNIISDKTHKLTSKLCKMYKYITIEDLKTKNMLKNHHLAKSIASSCFYEFRRQLEYKSDLYGNVLIVADSFYPSTQTCSSCGYVRKGKNKLTLNDRTYTCPKCGLRINRDKNAAINLKKYGMKEIKSINTNIAK